MAILKLRDIVPAKGLRIDGKIVSPDELIKNATKYCESGYAHYFIEVSETSEGENEATKKKQGRPPKN